MSAWILSREHIEFLVRAAIDYRLIDPARADEVGQMLHHENYLSIEARYGEEPETPEFHYRHQLAAVPTGELPTHWIVKAVGCYDYQTCEHGGYSLSEARRLVMAIRGCVREHDDEAQRKAYASNTDAPWGIELEHLGTLNAKALGVELP